MAFFRRRNAKKGSVLDPWYAKFAGILNSRHTASLVSQCRPPATSSLVHRISFSRLVSLSTSRDELFTEALSSFNGIPVLKRDA